MIRIIFVVLFCSLVSSQDGPPPMENCEFDPDKNPIGQLVSAQVNCKYKGGRYILKRGTDAGIEINFTTDQDVQKVKAIAHGIIAGQPIPYHLQEPDGCKVLPCPLHKNEGPYKYTTSLHVETFYPKLSVDVEWKLINEEEKTIVCIRIPTQIE